MSIELPQDKLPPELNGKPVFSYVSILRCRTYCIWPEWQNIGFHTLHYTLSTDGLETHLYLTPRIITYEGRPRPEIEPPAPESRETSPLIWRGDLGAGYIVGEKLLKAPEDSIPVEFKFGRALQGEIDIQFHIAASSEIADDALLQVVSPLSLSLASYINTILGDALIPSVPVQIRHLKANFSSTTPVSIAIHVKSRNVFDIASLTTAINSHLNARREMPPEVERAVDVALRRYFSSQTEVDPIDCYSDLWEACEVLARLIPKYTPVQKMAIALAVHMSRNTRKGIDRIKSALALDELYDIRNNLVHNAIEDLPRLQQKIPLLDRIAYELIRYNLGLPYEPTPIIENLLSKN